MANKRKITSEEINSLIKANIDLAFTLSIYRARCNINFDEPIIARQLDESFEKFKEIYETIRKE